MSSGIEGIGDKFLLKLYKRTINDGVKTVDSYEIGKEIGLVDVPTDNLVNVLVAQGFIKKIDRTIIYLSDDGRKRAEI
jgi:hypothetical protein